MTVAIGLVCKDGVLVAADSMSSDGFTAMKGRKVNTFGRTPAIWTASGSVFVMEEVVVALNTLDRSGTPDAPIAAFTTPVPQSIREKLTTAINPTMRKAYGMALSAEPFQPGTFPTSFATNFLILGYANGTPWFLEFAQDGQINWHTDLRFYTTGSGGPYASVALALMRHHLKDDLSLEDGKLLAYRTIATTIEVSSSGVGPPVQIAVCDSDGARVLDDDEIQRIETEVERWKTIESESLAILKTGGLDQNGAAEELPTIEEEPAT